MVERVWMLMEITDVGSRTCLLAQLEIQYKQPAQECLKDQP